MLSGVLAALAGALCWTLASSLWRRLPTALSASQLNLLKNALALLLLLPLLGAFGVGSQWSDPWAFWLLVASGVLGIAIGDSLFFAALRRIGTRRTLTLDAGGPAVTALLGMAALAESPSLLQWLGIALITAALALVAGRDAGEPRSRDWGLGVALALGALACGSGGAVLARAALRSGGIDPLQAAALRLLAATLVLLPLLPSLLQRHQGPLPQRRRWPLGILATLLGTSAGIALQQTALQQLPGALAVSLLATAPVMALPLASLEGDRPDWRGALAALMGLAGVSCVVA
ncbi:DMT family transporter [Synechococcus sp. CB0205]|uniref:DMT family transporter n=1 Tax=Synechococcus sp. CB0205 TaxID=232363 RepID=UPI00020026B1|nr:DMT family transporter [Synechococcus sp. CB0205]